MEDKTIWGIRAGRGGIQEDFFFKKNVVAISWSEMGDLHPLQTRDEFKAKYAQLNPEASPQKVATSAGQPYRFVREMRIGDFVVLPANTDKQIHIGEVVGEYEYQPGTNLKFPNQRAVKWVAQAPRTSFSQSALYEMGSAMTLFQIKNAADELFAVLEGKPLEPPEDEAIGITADEIEQLSRDYVLKQLERNLKGLPLEGFVKHLLETMGYRARLTRTNEPSIDIIAHKDELGVEPPIIKIQVKSSPGKIGDRDVSALYGKVGTEEFGLLVTLGEFTPNAHQFAGGKSNLRLIDGSALVDLIFEHYDSFDPRYKAVIPLKKVYIPQDLGGEGED